MGKPWRHSFNSHSILSLQAALRNLMRLEAVQLLGWVVIPFDRHKRTSGHHTKARNAPNSSILLSLRTFISPKLVSGSRGVQREPMNGLNTLCLLRGRLLVAAGEETTHDDVVGRGAYATPEREVGLFVGASVVPNLDPVGNVDEDAWLELPDNDSGARSVVVVRRSWAEVVPALRD